MKVELIELPNWLYKVFVGLVVLVLVAITMLAFLPNERREQQEHVNNACCGGKTCYGVILNNNTCTTFENKKDGNPRSWNATQ